MRKKEDLKEDISFIKDTIPIIFDDPVLAKERMEDLIYEFEEEIRNNKNSKIVNNKNQ